MRSCGVGTLGFDPAVSIAESAHPPHPASVFVNLLDDDANVDVGVARGRSLFSTLGDGLGGFTPLEPIRVGPAAHLVDVASGDFDGDGINDAVLADALRRRSVLTVGGTPSGRLAGPRRAVFLGGRQGPHGAVAGDWDDDGRADIATANKQARGITVLTRSDSADGDEWEREQVPLGFWPTDLAVADVDGDAAPDLVAGSARGSLAILLNRDGRFGDAVERVSMHPQRWWGPGASIDAVDLNRDGATDLVSLRTDGRLSVRLAERPALSGDDQGRGTSFQEPLETELDCSSGRRSSPRWSWKSLWGWPPRVGACRFTAIAMGDVDLDGILDLVATAPRASHDVLIRFGRGDGSFGDGFALRTPRGLGEDLRLADVNGDGRLDPVVGASDGAAFALPSRCACRAPFAGPSCLACRGDACPAGGDVLARQLTVGPPEIVRLGAELVGASLEEPRDLRRAATTAQRMAALTLESDAVVVAMPLRDRDEVIDSRGAVIPTTVTTFEAQEILKGAVRGIFEVSQEGGSFVSGEREDSANHVPFPSADDLAICPGAQGASASSATSPYWLLFLRAGRVLFSLVGDLTEPALQVESSADGFVLRERTSGLVLPVQTLAALPDRRPAR